MTFSAEIIAPLVALCSLSSGVAVYYLHKAKSLSKFGWLCMLINIVVFVYFNNFLLTKMIQLVADTPSGMIDVYNAQFVGSLVENIIWIIVCYIIASSYGGYLGAKRKFKIGG